MYLGCRVWIFQLSFWTVCSCNLVSPIFLINWWIDDNLDVYNISSHSCCQCKLFTIIALFPVVSLTENKMELFYYHLTPYCVLSSYYYFCTLILPIYCDLQHFEGDLSELELYFVIVNNEYGEQTEEELLPGGKNIRVTNENVITFIHLIANHRLNFQVRSPFS